jgi:SAM-dependent methyltransferase
MDYRTTNKAAWEEAFQRRFENWGDNDHARLANEELPFLHEDLIKEFKDIGLEGKTLGQFCCNNGRELLSLMQLDPVCGVGFDFAANILAQAKANAQKANISNCDFVETDILEIGEDYHNKFDVIFFTIGAITWFEDLRVLFDIVSRCLKKDGVMLINDFHPFMNMLPLPDEEPFEPGRLDKITYPYFKKDPWLETSGMGYMAGQYESKLFTSFCHTVADILNATIGAGMAVKKFTESNYDVGLSQVYDDCGYPLAYTLIAHKL